MEIEETEALRIVIWNIEWAAAKGRKGRALRERIWRLRPDVVCICEGLRGWMPDQGYLIAPDRPYGPHARDEHHKVMLWSRRPWREVHLEGSPILPPGRFVGATTDTPLGPVAFRGVCIPYHMSNVVHGTRESRAWEDHLRYLDGLRTILDDIPEDWASVLLGDFNQRIPERRVPLKAQESLGRALGDRFRIVTAGVLPGLDKQDVDHLACSGGLVASKVQGLSKLDSEGRGLSDHNGVFVELRA